MTEKRKAFQELERRVESLGRLVSVEPADVLQLVIPALDETMKPLASEIEGLHMVDDSIEGATSRATHYTSLETVLRMLSQETSGGNASLRLYDSLHCNDPEEGDFLVSCLSSAPSTGGWPKGAPEGTPISPPS